MQKDNAIQCQKLNCKQNGFNKLQDKNYPFDPILDVDLIKLEKRFKKVKEIILNIKTPQQTPQQTPQRNNKIDVKNDSIIEDKKPDITKFNKDEEFISFLNGTEPKSSKTLALEKSEGLIQKFQLK